VRIGIGYRALGDRILWFWIGSHAQYDRQFKSWRDPYADVGYLQAISERPMTSPFGLSSSVAVQVFRAAGMSAVTVAGVP
jgi:hypothetical protein